MRYEPDLITKFLELLKETPNIRYVCNKLGIHPATYYRWKIRHPEFFGEVIIALDIGRTKINDIAESVILKKVQEGDIGMCKYWLGNNNPRYMTREKSRQHSAVNVSEARFALGEGKPAGSVSFDDYFPSYLMLETFNGEQVAKDLMMPIIRISFPEEDAFELFLLSYAHWKKNKDERAERFNDVLEQAENYGIDTTDIQDPSLEKDTEKVIDLVLKNSLDTSDSKTSIRHMFGDSST